MTGLWGEKKTDAGSSLRQAQGRNDKVMGAEKEEADPSLRSG
jgi:hypothetical protein